MSYHLLNSYFLVEYSRMTFITYIPDIVVMTLFYILFLAKRWRTQNAADHLFFYLSACFVFLITLSPFLWNIPHLFSGIYSRFNFDPFVDLLNGYGSPLQECIENIVLFIPFAFCLRLAYHTSLWKALLIGILYSLAIELIQPLISEVRVFDITDIITNSCGALTGVLLYSLYADIRHKKK